MFEWMVSGTTTKLVKRLFYPSEIRATHPLN